MTKSIYLAGWEAHFNGDQQCEKFLATQVTDKATIQYLHSGIELIFKDDKLAKAFDYEEGKITKRALADDELGLAYPGNLTPHKLTHIVAKDRGRHQLGGEIPSDFKTPENNCKVPFQYLGYINNTGQQVGWLPFKIHLTCPIFLNFGNVFLDYSNPKKPVILNRAEVEAADTSYGEDLKADSEVIFHDLRFEFEEGGDDFSKYGSGGLPNWIQFPDIPTCPKSGLTMRFLCQLQGGVKAKRTNITPHEESWRHYYEQLNFWGDGDLFIFFQPRSRVACYFIQNT